MTDIIQVTQVVRLTPEVEKKIEDVVVLMGQVTNELRSVSDEDGYFADLCDSAADAYGNLWEFMCMYEDYKKGEYKYEN